MTECDHIRTYEHNNIEYLFNNSTKAAVMLKSVVHVTQKRKNKRHPNPYDIGARHTTTSVGKCALLHFMNNDHFTDFDLAVPIGSQSHEACLFFRKQMGLFEAIYFNPNYSEQRRGTQSSVIASALLNNKSLGRVRAFHSTNFEGKCSFLTWNLITNFMMHGVTPFDDPTIDLGDYNHIATEYQYGKRLKSYVEDDNDKITHWNMWRGLEDIFHDVQEEEHQLIARKLTAIAWKYHFEIAQAIQPIEKQSD